MIIELIENPIHDTSRKVISEFWSMAYALFQLIYETTNFALCHLVFDNTGSTDFQLITQLVENLIRGINRKVISPLLVYRFIYLSLFISEFCVVLVDV